MTPCQSAAHAPFDPPPRPPGCPDFPSLSPLTAARLCPVLSRAGPHASAAWAARLLSRGAGLLSDPVRTVAPVRTCRAIAQLWPSSLTLLLTQLLFVVLYDEPHDSRYDSFTHAHHPVLRFLDCNLFFALPQYSEYISLSPMQPQP